MEDVVLIYVLLFVGIILGVLLLCLWYGLRSPRSNRRRRPRPSIDSQTYELIAVETPGQIPPPYDEVVDSPPTYDEVMEDEVFENSFGNMLVPPPRYCPARRGSLSGGQQITTGRVRISSM